jgi:Flp pilus assembly protein TadG
MLVRLLRVMRRLKDHERGAILIYFTLALFPLLAVGGAAMDLGHVFLVKQKLTNGVDSAALALGARNNLNSDEATALVEAFIRTRYPGNLKSLLVSNTVAQVNVTATVQVPMTFMQVLNTQSVDVTVSAAAVRPQGKLEIALVLDQTGSMAGQKIENLKLAAKDLIDIVVWNNQTDHYYSKVAIVPYAAGVNVGNYAPSVRGPIVLGCLLFLCDIFQFSNAAGGSSRHTISTCVSERTGPQAFTDAAPSLLNPVGPNYPPPPSARNPCPLNPITPLTNDKTELKRQIDLLRAEGGTAGHIGVAWGWYLLSPNWGGLWPQPSQPAPYSDLAVLNARGDPLLRKIIILMTDGEFNTAYCQGVISQDSTSPGSTSDRIACNAPYDSFSQSRNLCTNIKATGILVYTIGFDLRQQSARNLMRDCATDTSHAYLASTGDELRQVFREIATRIATLRLTH